MILSCGLQYFFLKVVHLDRRSFDGMYPLQNACVFS